MHCRWWIDTGKKWYKWVHKRMIQNYLYYTPICQSLHYERLFDPTLFVNKTTQIQLATFSSFFVDQNIFAKLTVGMKGHQGFIASFYEQHIPMLLYVRLYANIHQHFTFPSLSLSLSSSHSMLHPAICLRWVVFSLNKEEHQKRSFSSKNAKIMLLPYHDIVHILSLLSCVILYQFLPSLMPWNISFFNLTNL